MKKLGITILTVFALFTGAWADRDMKYAPLDDWQKLGYVKGFQDLGETSVGILVQLGPAEYGKNVKRVLALTGLLVDKVQEGADTFQVVTDWKKQSGAGLSGWMMGFDSIRSRFVVNAVTMDSHWIRVSVQVDMEGARDGGVWKNVSERHLRNNARGFLVTTLACAFYGDSPSVQAAFAESKKNDTPLPSREEFRARYHIQPDGSTATPAPSH